MFTASTGLFVVKGQHYLQVIGADQYSFYHVPISPEQARGVQIQESIAIEEYHAIPDDSILLGKA